MHCKEVMQRINDSVAPDGEMLKHIKTCPDCARAFKAASILTGALKGEKENNIKTTPISEFRNRITERMKEKNKESIMSIMKNRINQRSGLVTGLSLAAIVFLFIVLVPFSYTTTVGYELQYTGLNNVDITQAQITQALTTFGYENVDVQLAGGNCLISGLPNKQDAIEMAIAFKALTGSMVEPEIKPILANISGSLYAQVKDRIKIDVETEDKTDEEIADEITTKLKKIYTNPVVVVTTIDEGRKIVIKTNESDSEITEAEIIELLLDSDGDISFETPAKAARLGLDIDTEGKTADEIKAEIEAKLAEQGEDGATVDVMTDPDGKHEIRIKLEKEKTVEE